MQNKSQPDLLPLSVAVLMGGQSLRFGSPKAFLPYRGKSLAAYLLSEASAFSSDVFAVSRGMEQVPPDARAAFPVVMDLWKEKGPLSGLHSALLHARYPAVFLCGVDMPFLKREVVEGLKDIWEKEGRPDAVVPRVDGRWDPLCALWSRRVLEALEPGRWGSFQQLLSEGPLRIRTVSREKLDGFDPGLKCLVNFNTRQEWSLTSEDRLGRRFEEDV